MKIKRLKRVLALLLCIAAFCMTTAFAENPLWIETAGEKRIHSNIIQYVAPDGKTSTEIIDSGIIWLYAENGDSGAWYGLDNSDGTFKLGSRFWVKWLDESNNLEEYEKYFNLLDTESRQGLSGNGRVLLFGVEGENEVEYTSFDTAVNLYIQLGDSWDANEIKSSFFLSGIDEKLPSFVSTNQCPDGKGMFAVMTLNHFGDGLYIDGTSSSAASIFTPCSIGIACGMAVAAAVVIVIILKKRNKQ